MTKHSSISTCPIKNQKEAYGTIFFSIKVRNNNENEEYDMISRLLDISIYILQALQILY